MEQEKTPPQITKELHDKVMQFCEQQRIKEPNIKFGKLKSMVKKKFNIIIE